MVTIAGEPFRHMLYHFMLPFSRWEFVWICFTESFETLTGGYSRAVRALGAVAEEHRTDNLAAAVPIGEKHVFQTRWEHFLSHYYVRPTKRKQSWVFKRKRVGREKPRPAKKCSRPTLDDAT